MNLISIGAFLSGLAVILGAFGAHGLRGKVDDDLLAIYKTGSEYLMIHAGAILTYGLWRKMHDGATGVPSSKISNWPAILFMAGIVIFCGSLYCIVFTGIRGFGMITPIGGLSFILGWATFGRQAWKN